MPLAEPDWEVTARGACAPATAFSSPTLHGLSWKQRCVWQVELSGTASEPVRSGCSRKACLLALHNASRHAISAAALPSSALMGLLKMETQGTVLAGGSGIYLQAATAMGQNYATCLCFQDESTCLLKTEVHRMILPHGGSGNAAVIILLTVSYGTPVENHCPGAGVSRSFGLWGQMKVAGLVCRPDRAALESAHRASPVGYHMQHAVHASPIHHVQSEPWSWASACITWYMGPAWGTCCTQCPTRLAVHAGSGVA